MVELVAPDVGVKELIVGGGRKVNPANEAAPDEEVTLTLPDEPAVTIAVILVGESIVNDAAAVPPKLTAFVPVKFEPVIVIVEPATPNVGVKELMEGGGIKVNPPNDAIPPGVVMLIFPVEPDPTTAVILVAEIKV
jgi:hypothetical protein